MNSLRPIEKNSPAPELPSREEVFRQAKQVLKDNYAALPNGPHSYTDRLAALDAVLPRAQAVLELMHHLARPATKKEIVGHLALLVGSFPNAGSADRTIYGRMLCEEIAADQASISDLEAACRQIRRTSIFLPAIAEVLKEIAEAKSQRRISFNEMTGLFKYREELLGRINKERLLAQMNEAAHELIRANPDDPTLLRCRAVWADRRAKGALPTVRNVRVARGRWAIGVTDSSPSGKSSRDSQPTQLKQQTLPGRVRPGKPPSGPDAECHMDKRLWLRITESDQRELDLIAEAMGGISRSAAMRFLIRQWRDQRKASHSDTQVAKRTP